MNVALVVDKTEIRNCSKSDLRSVREMVELAPRDDVQTNWFDAAAYEELR